METGPSTRPFGLDRASDPRRSYLLVLLTIAILACGWFALLNLPRGMILLGSAELLVSLCCCG